MYLNLRLAPGSHSGHAPVETRVALESGMVFVHDSDADPDADADLDADSCKDAVFEEGSESDQGGRWWFVSSEMRSLK